MSVKLLRDRIRDEVGKVVFGQEEALDFALAAMLSGGHVLLEGPPGSAKTLLVKALAASMQLAFGRVQMTSDMLPGDITGASIFREDTREFVFKHGPIFTNFLLADEINRASAKTQSALLEAMQEYGVTHDGVTHALPTPFLLFATQNPIDQEGTYPLPLAQQDRFMFKVLIEYPDAGAEERMLTEHHVGSPHQRLEDLGLTPVVKDAHITQARSIIQRTYVREEVVRYVRQLAQATREDDALLVGASPRAALMTLMGAKALARFEDREYVIPDDIKRAFIPGLRHRVVLSPSAELEGAHVDHILFNVLDRVEAPRATQAATPRPQDAPMQPNATASAGEESPL